MADILDGVQPLSRTGLTERLKRRSQPGSGEQRLTPQQTAFRRMEA